MLQCILLLHFYGHTDGPCPARSALRPYDSQPLPSPPKNRSLLVSLLLASSAFSIRRLARFDTKNQMPVRSAGYLFLVAMALGRRVHMLRRPSRRLTSLTPPRSCLSACGWAVYAVNSVVSSRFVPESSLPRSSNSTDDAFQASTLYPHRISHFCPDSSSRSSSLSRHSLQAAPCCPPWASQARPLIPPL